MKKTLRSFFIISIVSILSTSFAYAQVGIGTEAPNERAVLDLRSPTNKGFLVLRLMTAQRTTAIQEINQKGEKIKKAPSQKGGKYILPVIPPKN